MLLHVGACTHACACVYTMHVSPGARVCAWRHWGKGSWPSGWEVKVQVINNLTSHVVGCESLLPRPVPPSV